MKNAGDARRATALVHVAPVLQDNVFLFILEIFFGKVPMKKYRIEPSFWFSFSLFNKELILLSLFFLLRKGFRLFEQIRIGS